MTEPPVTVTTILTQGVLCDSDPPPLVCIDEPELGLHPDLMPKLADLMRTASARTQLVVTTHSDILIDAMTEEPEAVVVVEKHDARTTMNQLSTADLKSWLDRYRLGELWTRGRMKRNWSR